MNTQCSFHNYVATINSYMGQLALTVERETNKYTRVEQTLLNLARSSMVKIDTHRLNLGNVRTGRIDLIVSLDAMVLKIAHRNHWLQCSVIS